MKKAFTLIELLVVIAIIGLLSTIAVVALTQSGVNSRNTKRKADLIQISKALELYYADNGSYPSTSGGWWSVTSAYGSHDDSGANGWIPNLAPTYMAALPRDPNTLRLNSGSAQSACRNNTFDNCYAYQSDGTDYKLLALCVPEGTLSATDPFYDQTRPTWSWAVYTPGGKAW